MEEKKIAIIGIGGRTGTMFAFELERAAKVLGVGRKRDVEKIKRKRFFILRGKEKINYQGSVISQEDFESIIPPDFIFLCLKNPIGPAVKYYYRRFSKSRKIPSLILSQNGLSAVEDAKKELKNIFRERAEEIRIIRVSLFNPVSAERKGDNVAISYSPPVQLAFGKASGPGKVEEIKKIFDKAGIEAEEIPEKDIKNMEYSKLFTNLIGMASASRRLTIEEGFQKREVFEEEIGALREYRNVVRKNRGRFLNFRAYPVKYLSYLIYLPLPVLSAFRKIILMAIIRKRAGKEKGNIDEVRYYNGAVTELGRRLSLDVPINENVYQRIKKIVGAS